MNIFDAIREGSLEEVQNCASVEDADINIKNNNGNTALMYAVIYDRMEIAKFLCKVGADINIKNKYGDTALVFAACNGHLEIVKFLCKVGADISMKNNNGETALMIATQSGYIKVVKFLEEFQQKSQVRTLRTLCISDVYKYQIPHKHIPEALLFI